VTYIGPVGGLMDPAFLRAWRQAQLEQQAVERHGGGAHGAAKRARGAYATQPDPRHPDDGFRPGDGSFVGGLQEMLREILDLAGSHHELGRMLANAPPERYTVLQEAITAQPVEVAGAIAWIIEHLHRTEEVATACGELGPALARILAGREQHLDMCGRSIIDAIRTGLGDRWKPDFDGAMHSAWGLVAEWLRRGMERIDYQTPYWTGVVVARDGLAVRLRTHLPYPYHPGQHVALESSDKRAGDFVPAWISGAPAPGRPIEVYVDSLDAEPGDRIRLREAAGDLKLFPPSQHALLLVAEGIGVAPMKALLTQLREAGDTRVAHLFWGVRHREDLFDLEGLRALRATVKPVVAEGPAYPYASGAVYDVVAEHGDWHSNDVYVAGEPAMVEKTIARLTAGGVPVGHIATGVLTA
jgi:NAD(P)H-flavin reductase